MDFNPDDARQYIVEDVEYPASKEDLIAGAQSNGAPEELIERLGTLSTPDFSNPDEVVTELRSSPTAG